VYNAANKKNNNKLTVTASQGLYVQYPKQYFSLQEFDILSNGGQTLYKHLARSQIDLCGQFNMNYNFLEKSM